MVATSHVWLLNISDVAIVVKVLNVCFTNLNLNSYLQFMIKMLDDAGLDRLDRKPSPMCIIYTKVWVCEGHIQL